MNKLHANNMSSMMLAPGLGIAKPMRVYASSYAYVMRKFADRSKYTPHVGKRQLERWARRVGVA